jgi:hypothetical protein
MDNMNITVETTYYKTNGQPHGWKGHGSVEHSCGSHVDVGTGDHSMVEEYYCPQCQEWFQVDWYGFVK